MNEKILVEILKYSNPKVLYIITFNNLLKALFCPFGVLVLNDIGNLEQGQIVWVDEIKVTMDLKTVYVINGRFYHYHHFEIIADEQ